MNWNNFKNMINVEDIEAVKNNPEYLYTLNDGTHLVKLVKIETAISKGGTPMISFIFKIKDNKYYVSNFYLFKSNGEFNPIGTRMAIKAIEEFVGQFDWNDIEELRQKINGIEIQNGGIDSEIVLTTKLGSTFQNIAIKNTTDKFAKMREFIENMEDDDSYETDDYYGNDDIYF